MISSIRVLSVVTFVWWKTFCSIWLTEIFKCFPDSRVKNNQILYRTRVLKIVSHFTGVECWKSSKFNIWQSSRVKCGDSSNIVRVLSVENWVTRVSKICKYLSWHDFPKSSNIFWDSNIEILHIFLVTWIWKTLNIFRNFRSFHIFSGTRVLKTFKYLAEFECRM